MSIEPGREEAWTFRARNGWIGVAACTKGTDRENEKKDAAALRCQWILTDLRLPRVACPLVVSDALFRTVVQPSFAPCHAYGPPSLPCLFLCAINQSIPLNLNPSHCCIRFSVCRFHGITSFCFFLSVCISVYMVKLDNASFFALSILPVRFGLGELSRFALWNASAIAHM
jgi:hypothetical protein